jgi:hypothetical protein
MIKPDVAGAAGMRCAGDVKKRQCAGVTLTMRRSMPSIKPRPDGAKVFYYDTGAASECRLHRYNFAVPRYFATFGHHAADKKLLTIFDFGP